MGAGRAPSSGASLHRDVGLAEKAGCRSDTASNGRPRLALVAIAAALTTLAALLSLSLSLLLNLMGSDAAQSRGTIVSTASTSLGRILVNSRGHTLYLFSRDRKGKSVCTGTCASFWLPLLANGKPRVAGGAKASLIGTTKRVNGRLQVT